MSEAVALTADEAVAALRAAAWTEHIPEDHYEEAVKQVRAICEPLAGSAETAERVLAADILAAVDQALGTPRTLIHCVSGHGFGADWDLDSAVAEVREAAGVAWRWSLFRHDLAVTRADGSVWRFEVAAPEAVRQAWMTAATIGEDASQ